MKHYGWIPEQTFEVGDVITWQSGDGRDEPMYRLITEVRIRERPSDRAPRRFYTWEYLDRGIDHGRQHRDDHDYISENSSDPQLFHWRRVLSGARRVIG
jgi:hypothetical protein